ncbi:MAG TPA: CAP domain-containing protein [Polyangiales bacterium]
MNRALALEELNRARGVARCCGSDPQVAVPPLVRDARLDAAAQLHSEEMARRELLDHFSASGASAFDRIRAAGYSFRAAAENIASGNERADATIAQLVGSPGHCRNIMSPLYLHVGIGHARSPSGQHYWTLDFAAPW